MNAAQADYSHLVIDSSDGKPNWDDYGPEVTKIVLGNSPTDDDATAITINQLPDDLAERFPALTQLCLWKIESLERLPQLPPSLRCLDVRGCADLVEIPDLPKQLETLDVGFCPKLKKLPHQAPEHLERFYFDGCDSLTTRILENMLASLKEQKTPVVEIQGSETGTVTSLHEFPATTLKKLVLRGCVNLSDAENLADFQQLDHLDLQGCTKLKALPDIPPSVRFLALYGADDLTTFMGQSVGPYDRGKKEKQNVAPIFNTRRKFGGELAIMPHAKLLLLGDGRVGKTTLAKRLQWEELDEDTRQTPAGQDLRPLPDEEFTDKVQFWRWNTGIALPPERMNDLCARADSAGVPLPLTSQGFLDGAVRIWDFGGQEQYHNTHRIFASEGSIFLVVWQAEQPDPGEPPEDMPPQEWKEGNRQRSLDYWLDYIFDMRDQPDVALVCTNCKDPDEMAERPNWWQRAQRHRDRDLPCFFVDSLDDQCGQHQEYQRLLQWIRDACGKEAYRIGIRQPKFFRSVSDQVDDWLRVNSESRNTVGRAEHVFLNWDDWRESVRQVYERIRENPSIELEERDVTTITDYLHDAGHLFQIRHSQHRAVLVDQEWASDRIYKLLGPRDPFRKKVKAHGGWFYLSDLESDEHWEALADDAQRQRLLAYMQQCRVVTKIADRQSHPLDQDVYLASDKWLLPTLEHVKAKIDEQLDGMQLDPGMGTCKTFELEDVVVSEFQLRSLQAYLASFFGIRATYFRTGLQAMEADANPDWCFRIQWSPNPECKDAFFGKVEAVLVARHKRIDAAVQQIEELLYADASPLADARKLIKRKSADEKDLAHREDRPLGGDDYDVAVSSSRGDKAEAEEIVNAMRDAGLKVNRLPSPDCRADDPEGVLAFMNNFRRPKFIVLLLSDSYLRNDPQENWYCPWELADAIVRISDGAREADQTLVVFRESESLTFAKCDATVNQLFKDMKEHFQRVISEVAGHDPGKFQRYEDFAHVFSRALEVTTACELFGEQGLLANAIGDSTLPRDESGATNFSSVVTAAKRTVKDRKQMEAGVLAGMDLSADTRHGGTAVEVVRTAEAGLGDYDVFLAHNSVDKEEVRKLARALREKYELRPWLDEEEIPPGRPFQDHIQKALSVAGAAAVILGSKGLGKWQHVELRSLISQFVDRSLPVIPVLLPNAEFPQELLFLKELNWVQFKDSVEDEGALDKLYWGITGNEKSR